MGDGLQNMEGANQYIRPSKQTSNSPVPQRQGKTQKLVAKGKNGQLKSQKFVKSGNAAAGGQRNTCFGPDRGKGGQNARKTGSFADKRPPSRGLRQLERFDPLAVDHEEIQLDYDFSLTSGKKDSTSLNHLLNFKYAPLQQTYHGAWSSRKKNSFSKWNHFNKEQFLQANCQFVVRTGGDYTVNFIDPDVIVDWELIEQVRVRCREMPSCPICLYPPTAAQMTRCGHIYCWSCILHYLSLSEKTWRKCPICYESVHQKDLKSVMAVSESSYSVGQEIAMTLMKRNKDSVFALPKIKWTERTSIPELKSDDVQRQFSKLLLASPQEILNEIMAKDRSELSSQLIEVEADKSGEESFVQLAIQHFEAREKKLLEFCEKEPSQIPAPDSLEDTSSTQEDTVEHIVNFDSSRISVSSDDSSCSSVPSENTNFYYFYQAKDGQYIFLHPVNARCLIEEYGSLEHCPQTIRGTIVEMDCYTQTEDLRRRFRYLRHLPLTCEFAICEIDLKPPHVSWQTLNHFKDDLRKRRVRRQKKAKEETKHDNKCKSKMSSAFIGIKQPQYDDAGNVETPNLDSEQDFPHQVGSSPNVWIASSPPTQGAWSNAGTDDVSLASGASFAKALSAGSLSVSKPRIQNAKPQSEGPRQNESEKCSGDEDECEPAVPSFQSAFTDALKFADLNLNVESVPQLEKTCGRGKRNKRKGKDKRLLFSTDRAMKL